MQQMRNKRNAFRKQKKTRRTWKRRKQGRARKQGKRGRPKNVPNTGNGPRTGKTGNGPKTASPRTWKFVEIRPKTRSSRKRESFPKTGVFSQVACRETKTWNTIRVRCAETTKTTIVPWICRNDYNDDRALDLQKRLKRQSCLGFAGNRKAGCIVKLPWLGS